MANRRRSACESAGRRETHPRHGKPGCARSKSQVSATAKRVEFSARTRCRHCCSQFTPYPWNSLHTPGTRAVSSCVLASRTRASSRPVVQRSDMPETIFRPDSAPSALQLVPRPRFTVVNNAIYARSVEMPLCEGAARPGLQVPLEAAGVRLVTKLNDHMPSPGPVFRSVERAAVVVPLEPVVNVTRHANVKARTHVPRLQHVHETLRRHAGSMATGTPTETGPNS